MSVVTTIAIGFAWYARNSATRTQEPRSLARIEELTENRTSIFDISDAVNHWCGTWSGGVVYTELRGPAFIRCLDLDAFRRVTHIEFQHEENPDLVVELDAFEELESVSCSNWTTRLSDRSQSAAELAGVLYLFRSTHPDVDVRYDGSNTTAYEVSQSILDDLLGGVDSQPNVTGNDPFGGVSAAYDDPFWRRSV
ncbi:hypothetical protein CA13_10330 [Planctomycetes bacterium CA13]|uniref:Uncharacterized protein n=1 Tax=Novipirellula herctigrandis TaxID=2527986 RepID=A0A5C5YX45_9BACT|nr:hypothetical protein CA13_10330 [Planctomycetes bacterium CA13]